MKKSKWYLNRKVNYYPFDIYLVNQGYTKYQQKNFGLGFKNTFYYFRDGVIYSLRGQKDIIQITRYLEGKFSRKFAERFSQIIRAYAREFLKVTKVAFRSRLALVKNFDHFCLSFENLFSVFQMPEYAQLFLKNADRDLLIKFGMSRDFAARQCLVPAENIFRKRLGEILNINPERALMLLPEEVKTALRTGKFPAKFNRRKTFAMLFGKNKLSVCWNKEADRMFAREYADLAADKNIKELKGNAVYAGLVRGQAYVALNYNDFVKMPAGAIVICSMTRYDAVPFLKKVKAVVTDQGGLTCHAAIIAREFKIPTIVGTKIATEVFKNGDMVEVDANTGVVRKVK